MDHHNTPNLPPKLFAILSVCHLSTTKPLPKTEQQVLVESGKQPLSILLQYLLQPLLNNNGETRCAAPVYIRSFEQFLTCCWHSHHPYNTSQPAQAISSCVRNSTTTMREIVLDPDGDVRLQLQDSPDDTSSNDSMADADNQDASELTSAHLGIIVSSYILCNASTVFRAMLGPGGKFREATELRQNQASSSIYTLELPEDHAEAALVWCSFLHAKTKDIPKKPSAWFLTELATFAFKYDCVEILEYPGKVWVGDLHRQISQRIFTFDRDESLYDDGLESVEELCQCLYFAYTIDLPEEYAMIAGILVKVEGGDGTSSPYTFLDRLHFDRDVGGMYHRTTWTHSV